MNTQLVNSIIQVIQSLSVEERSILEEKLFFEAAYPGAVDLAALAVKGSSFDFLAKEPDLYTLDDGIPIDDAR